MTTAESITQMLQALPEEAQREVLDFVEFLRSRAHRSDVVREADTAWSEFSLSSAMRGMEGEPSPYTIADVKESFH